MHSSFMGFVYILVTLLGLLGVYSSAVTERLGIGRCLFLCCGLAVASCLVLGQTQHAIPSVSGILALRFADTLFQPLQIEMQNKQIAVENRATVLSIYAMLIDGVAIGTNLIFGALSDWNLPAAFFFGGGVSMLSLFFFFLWGKYSESP